MLSDHESIQIGLIGDIHANLPALKSVVRTLEDNKVHLIVNCGDFVGYNAFPEQVVKFCRRKEILSVIGNYDLKVLKFPIKKKKWRKKKHPQKWTSFKWSFENLSNDSRKYLENLPEQLSLKIGGKRLLVVHGSPESVNEHLFSTTPNSRFLKFSEQTGADVVVFGHSHEPFLKQIGKTLFVNTGSVGRPDDGDPRATAAILRIGRNITVRHLRIPYDIDQAVMAILRNKLPNNFAKMIKRGRSLDWILHGQ